MSLFNTYEDITENKPITEEFLIENGFEKIGWGSPTSRKEDPIGHTCWEKYIEIKHDRWSHIQSAVLYYFPDTFKGYVTCFRFNGKNKCLGWLNYADSDWEHKGDINSRFDLLTSIDIITTKLKEYV